MDKDIYELTLNESITINQTATGYTNIMCVPGGWIYTTHFKTNYCNFKIPDTIAVTSCFVPYAVSSD